jgi:uncharacterized protein
MTRPKTFEPGRLDVRAFADAGATLAGELPLAALPRLSAGTLATDAAPPPARWHATGELRPVTGGAPEVWLHLTAAAHVTLQCQRCLQPMPQALDVDRWFRFAASEDEAARLDEDSEDDVLVESRRFDLAELVEDELILALPIVPRHETCPAPLPVAATDAEPAEERPNPFAALAALRRPPGGS